MSLVGTGELLLAEDGPAALARTLSGHRPGDEPVRLGISSPLRPALLAALLEDRVAGLDGPVLLVTPDDRSARELASELAAYLDRRRVRLYPSRGTGYASQVDPPPHLTGMRIDAIDSLQGSAGDAPLVVAGAGALAETVPERSLRPAGFELAVGEERSLEVLADELTAAGYERVDQVEERGQFSVRGGILDLFTATGSGAARIDFFGDEIESIRQFSTFTQRSLGEVDRVEVAPAAELDLEHRELARMALEDAAESAEGPDLADLLPVDRFLPPLELVPEDALVALVSPGEIERSLNYLWDDVTSGPEGRDAHHLYVDVASDLADRADLVLDLPREGETDDSGDGTVLRATRADSPARNLAEAEAEIKRLTEGGYRVVIAFDTVGEAERTKYALESTDAAIASAGEIPASPGTSLVEARLREGFIWPAGRMAVFPFRRLVNRRLQADERTPGTARGRLAFSDLRVGDFVVHEDHGVARFAGFETREVAGVTRDYLYLEYKGEDRVYAPVEQLDKLSRYAGGAASPTLSALGGKKWLNMKAKARKAAAEMAGELVNLYAERRAAKGHSFAQDSEWQVELEAGFPHRETLDQVEAIEAIKADMESDRPMDRLVCGDVGYGKTEVAIRAATKAASDGKQVLILSPTTILVQQHLGTFRERMADLPFRIESVSRLRSPAETKKVLAEFREGKVDILIGTHRLLSRDVKASDLGLVIVDEEQRFGVKQKELLRQLKLEVDVLSMSATPIPRSLQMSMSGLRDISVIETPPEGRRPVRTWVGPWDEELVQKAIRREKERGGQVFYLHNRVESLDAAAERLRAIVPDLRVVVAHGQMDESGLEEAMLAFMRGEADCLVATTIIESGIDIPSANTLIVERADQLGLAQAYQIRGRVGRSRERAFAYLLYPSEEALTEEAATRLATLADHTELGSGFRIAMRDLDIRGAGNLLGDEQSGHVAAVGFELYCQLIDEAVAELNATDGQADEPRPIRVDVDVDAYLPSAYIPYEAAKIDIHRRIAGARRSGDLAAIEAELADRFGPLPEPVSNLLSLQRARIAIGQSGANAVQFSGGKLVATGLELDSEAAEALRGAIDGVAYDWRSGEASVAVSRDPQEKLEMLESLAGALSTARTGMLSVS